MARKGPFFAALSLLVLLAMEPARAHLLPAEEILASIGRNRARLEFSTLVTTGTHQIGAEEPYPVWEAIRAGRARRIEHKRPEGTEVDLAVGAKRWRFQLGQKASPTKDRWDELILAFLGTPLNDPGGARGLAFIEARKIDKEVVSLGRHDHRIVYIVGAKPWEPEKPQIWIDKELRVPVRLVEIGEGGEVREIRLYGIGSAVMGEWCPESVERWENGQLREAFTYERCEPNVELDDDLFVPPT